MFRVDRDRVAVTARSVHQFVPPVVAVGGHPDLAAGAANDDDLLHAGRLGKALVDRDLERDFLAAPPTAISCDHDLRLSIVVAVGHRICREPAEDDGVRRPNAGTGEHRDRQLGDHRHVERDAVAGLDAQPNQHVGELADLAMQVLIGQHASVAGLPFPDDRRLVLPPCRQVPIDAVVTGIRLPADEPLGVRHRADHRLVERLEPVQMLLGQIAPEPSGVVLGPRPHLLVLLFAGDVGEGGELRWRREPAGFVERALDVVGHSGEVEG